MGNAFNLFFPWTVNQDGTREETLNHVGRHELRGFVDRSLTYDPNVVAQGVAPAHVVNRNVVQNVMQIREDPLNAGVYYAVDAPEFFTHSAGQVIRITAPAGMSPNEMTVDYVTPRETHAGSNNPTSQHTGLYRNPLDEGLYAFIVGDGGEIDQQLIFPTADGKLDARQVRRVSVPSPLKQCVAASDGQVYAAEETVGIWRFTADPEADVAAALIDSPRSGRFAEEDLGTLRQIDGLRQQSDSARFETARGLFLALIQRHGG